ncbi:cadherin-1-like [Limanda limanda]|uniref:cadherin-1-like n=1 Tax=Limanda limanda TaxID=27771 RepID=UPI0029C97999|nr:cadherin-1-like [Limanda limanda]
MVNLPRRFLECLRISGLSFRDHRGAKLCTWIQVTRKHLERGTRLGRVGFNDGTNPTRFSVISNDRRFIVHPDGILMVGREVFLHEGHLDFFIHVRNSHGKKMTVPVKVVHHGLHRGHHQGDNHVHHHQKTQGKKQGDHHGHSHLHHQGKIHGHQHGQHQRKVEHHLGEQRHHNNQHHLNEVDSANNTENATTPEVPVLKFPKSVVGLKRRKRDWVIPAINVPENHKGPYPHKESQIRSSEDTVKTIYYSITGPGADEPPYGLFTMDKFTGTLYLTQPLDREKQARYTLQAHAAVEGSRNAEEPMDFIVNVIDQNDNKPVFVQDTFLGEVPESSPTGFEVITVLATDMDEPGNANSIVRYRILSLDPVFPSGPLFAINPITGAIRVNARGLDREKNPKHTLVIEAADMEGEGLTVTTRVIITVSDSNDNPPAFTQSTYEATVPENRVGALVVTMVVTDRDEPHSPAWNAKFKIVDGDPGGLFTVTTGSNKQEGIITTAKGLDFEMIRKHTLLVAVENDIPFATPLPTATAIVVVNVQDVNEAPVFEPLEKFVSKRENRPVDSDVVQYIASDPDIARKQTVIDLLRLSSSSIVSSLHIEPS